MANLVQNITYPANATQEEQQDQQPEVTDNTADNATPFTADDVDKMSDDEVLDNVFVNVPQNIDNLTRQKLFQRSDEIRRQRESDGNAGKSAEELAKGVIRRAQSFLRSTNGK